jgi:tRNA(Met) C34 N-acetyltransferase TmcA
LNEEDPVEKFLLEVLVLEVEDKVLSRGNAEVVSSQVMRASRTARLTLS